MIHVGVDIGGTGIQTGVVDDNGKMLAETSIITRVDLSFPEQVGQIVQSVRDVLAKAGYATDDLQSVGVGIPGIADKKTGVIINCNNLGWRHAPFRQEFQKHLDMPVYLENDANVAALAESYFGVSAGTSSSVFITLGTGVGSGIIINGKVWTGYHGIGGELGHTILEIDGIPCTCGNDGCTERYCSATAIIWLARQYLQMHPDSLIMDMIGGNLTKINAKIVFDAAKELDPTAAKIVQFYIKCLARTIANVVNFFDPEVIVLGGGVSKAGDYLLDNIMRIYPDFVLFNELPMPEVKIAKLGPEAGIIGAAMLKE